MSGTPVLVTGVRAGSVGSSWRGCGPPAGTCGCSAGVDRVPLPYHREKLAVEQLVEGGGLP
jgi:hypothetical protein